MDGYVSVETEDNISHEPEEESEEEEVSEDEGAPIEDNNYPWKDKMRAMNKLKELAKKPASNPDMIWNNKMASSYKFKQYCEDNSIPYLEENKTNIEMLVSAGMLVLQTYLLASITIINMFQSSIIENKVVHDMLGGLMDRGIRLQHYCFSVFKSHKIDSRLQTIFDPYKAPSNPDVFNNKLDVIYEEALTRYMSTEQDTVDGGSNAKKTV